MRGPVLPRKAHQQRRRGSGTFSLPRRRRKRLRSLSLAKNSSSRLTKPLARLLPSNVLVLRFSWTILNRSCLLDKPVIRALTLRRASTELNRTPFARRLKANPTRFVHRKATLSLLVESCPDPSPDPYLALLRRRVLKSSRTFPPSKCHLFVEQSPFPTTVLLLCQNLPSPLLTLRECIKKRMQLHLFLLDHRPVAHLFDHLLIFTLNLLARHHLHPPNVISRCHPQPNLLDSLVKSLVLQVSKSLEKIHRMRKILGVACSSRT